MNIHPRSLMLIALLCMGGAAAQNVRLVVTPKSSNTRYKIILPNNTIKNYTGKQTLTLTRGSQVCVEKGSIRYDLFVDNKKKLSKSMFPDSGCEKVWAPSPSFGEAVANYFEGVTRFFLPSDDAVTVSGSSKAISTTTCYDISTDVVVPSQYPFREVMIPLNLPDHGPMMLQLKDQDDQTLSRIMIDDQDTEAVIPLQDFRRASKYEVYEYKNFQPTLLFEGKTTYGDWQSMDFSAMNTEETMNWLLESQIQPYKVAVYSFLAHQSNQQSHTVAQRIAEDIRQAYMAYNPDTAFECNNLLDETQQQTE
ncbi:hypothetical protein [Deinococcus cellulosilyticus]|uniref:Uncharacterized protein n=1 Tax=Deinococcus cellulosilyticus (strain DSM 18568 / NBRC 106333 / KACC 11606 / 5516J-15) TaxID=1223518 RepID=A0A511MX30_DEIC1|nr:hypothetical protein [Deinococcus cellulosilyticus]GEM45120.1 hypothetical protein DC3_07550 [Deinococcus cellulosilyticus NBRC 106333 = KACC 11606]